MYNLQYNIKLQALYKSNGKTLSKVFRVTGKPCATISYRKFYLWFSSSYQPFLHWACFFVNVITWTWDPHTVQASKASQQCCVIQASYERGPQACCILPEFFIRVLCYKPLTQAASMPLVMFNSCVQQGRQEYDCRESADGKLGGGSHTQFKNVTDPKVVDRMRQTHLSIHRYMRARGN